MRPRKYRNKPTENAHGRFDSRGEANRYTELVLLERAGQISELRRQVALPLYGYNKEPIKYPSGRQARVVVDFVYVEAGARVYEDFKGTQTAMSKLQHAILRCQGIEIKISRR